MKCLSERKSPSLHLDCFACFCCFVGMVHHLSWLEGGTLLEVGMHFYNFMKAFVYIALVLETF